MRMLIDSVCGGEEPARHLINDQALVRGADVVLDRSARGVRGAWHRIPPGTVIVRQTSSGRFVPATDPGGDRNTPASVTARQSANSLWSGGEIVVSLVEGLGFHVPLDRGASDNPAVIDQLNRSLAFRAHFVADEQLGRLRIRTRAAGALSYLHVSATYPGAFGPQGTAGHGRDADYRVTDSLADVRSPSGEPIHAVVRTLLSGHFDEWALQHMTAEARTVLARRGAIFRRRYA